MDTQTTPTGKIYPDYPEFREVPVQRDNKKTIVDLSSWPQDKKNQFADHLANSIKRGVSEVLLGTDEYAILFNCGPTSKLAQVG